MKFIAHRGNVSQAIPDKENTIEYIDETICQGYDCEVDVREYLGGLYLGHDYPQEEISVEWLLDRAHNLFIHAKTVRTLEMLSLRNWNNLLNYFYHEDDFVVQTSRRNLWVHPKSDYLPQNSIFVMSPQEEMWNFTVGDLFDRCMGICTDRPQQWEQIWKKHEKYHESDD